jgi:predicted ATPase
MLGYAEAALADTDFARKDAREIGHAVTLIYALCHGSLTHFLCGNYPTATAEAEECVALADEKGALVFKTVGMIALGSSLAASGKNADAIQAITSGIKALRSSGAILWAPLSLAPLARAHAALGQFDDAWRCIGDALTAVANSKESWWEAEVHRATGEIALKSPEPDAAKAETYFERALAVARWELRASMSLARLWRDQGKVQQAREVLAPVYGWFTEGFDTRDLKEAKALLEELAA